MRIVKALLLPLLLIITLIGLDRVHAALPSADAVGWPGDAG
ncbi:hypothetical protein [Pseudomonas typographi]|nr:hypothetical protein [Pseudomonas typographi]